MNRKEIEYKIMDLKTDYVRLQHDLEKLEYVKGNLHPLEKQLEGIEEELRELNKLLDQADE
ncbi:SE1832 family protein [Bacillus niameyensis]|uniref:SE1832 family protein n=1 Tax=Bacillus niameyensis TaxID=1522308 RepID=UPI000781AB33|nr:SE1832 family protein [Bacillus niameyensis]